MLTFASASKVFEWLTIAIKRIQTFSSHAFISCYCFNRALEKMSMDPDDLELCRKLSFLPFEVSSLDSSYFLRTNRYKLVLGSFSFHILFEQNFWKTELL